MKKKTKFDIRGWALCNTQQDVAFDEPYIMRMLEEAVRCDINYIEFVGPYYNQPERCPIDSLINYREFSKLNDSTSMPRDLETIKAENAKFNRVCTHAKSLGMATTIWFHELWFPRDILEFYPEMGDDQGNVVYSSQEFQRFFRSKFEELFETIPDLSGLVLTTCESLALNIFNLPAQMDRHMSKYQAYVHMVNAIAQVCKKNGRDLYVRMFGLNDPQVFYALSEAFKEVAPEVRVHQKTCDHGDWQNPFQKANSRHGAFERRFEIAEEELGQECFEQGRFPVVYPEVLQHRARNCMENGVGGIVARIDRAANRAWDHEGQLNIVAFNALLQNSDADLAEVVWPWAQSYYGQAHPYAIKALEQGAWIFHDMSYVYPGEDYQRFRRGRLLDVSFMMDDQLGPFGAMREAGGYRTPKELAITRCERLLQDLRYGENALSDCTEQQKLHYHTLQKKFEDLLNFGKEKLAMLEIQEAFSNLFYSNSNRVKNGRSFHEAIERSLNQFGKDWEHQTIEAMIKMLEATQKLDVNTYGGYVHAGDI